MVDPRFNECVLVHSMDFVGDTDNNSNGQGYNAASHFESVLQNTHYEIAASGRGEYAGTYGVFVKGTVSAAYSHDVYSYVKDGKRLPSVDSNGNMPEQMTYEKYLEGFDRDKTHIMCEFFVKNFKVVGVWFNCSVPAIKHEVLAFLKGKNIPVFKVQGESVFPYVESEDRILRKYRRNHGLASA